MSASPDRHLFIFLAIYSQQLSDFLGVKKSIIFFHLFLLSLWLFLQLFTTFFYWFLFDFYTPTLSPTFFLFFLANFPPNYFQLFLGEEFTWPKLFWPKAFLAFASSKLGKLFKIQTSEIFLLTSTLNPSYFQLVCWGQDFRIVNAALFLQLHQKTFLIERKNGSDDDTERWCL